MTKKEKKQQKGVPVGYSIFKSDRLPTRATAYDKRNGKQVLLRDKKHIPKWVREELTDEEISHMLLVHDVERQ